MIPDFAHIARNNPQKVVDNDPTLVEIDLSDWFDLRNNTFADIKYFFDALKTNCYLQKLNLSRARFGKISDDCEKALADALEGNTVLTEIRLDVCDFTHIYNFARMLRTNRSLRNLSLEAIKFGNSGGRALAEALKVNKVLTKLELGSCDLTDIKEFAQMLTTNRSLLEIDLRCNRFGTTGGQLLAQAIRVNTTLNSLCLYQCKITNIYDLADALKVNHSLTVLGLAGNELGDRGGLALLGALRINTTLIASFNLNAFYPKSDIDNPTLEFEIEDKIRQNAALKLQAKESELKEKKPAEGTAQPASTIVRAANTTNVVAATSHTTAASASNHPALQNSRRHRALRAHSPEQMRSALGGGVRATTAGAPTVVTKSNPIIAIIQRVENNDPTLTVADLNSCGLTDITRFAKVLTNNRHLSKLRIGGNAFGNAGGIALGDVLRVNRTLTEVNVNSCNLSDISDIAEALKTNHSLKRLGLGWNTFGNRGGLALAGALKVNVALTHLNLNSCDLTDITDLAKALTTNHHLSRLDLGNNPFGNAGGRALLQALKENSTLIELNTTLCDIDSALAQEIAEKIKHNASVKTQRKPNGKNERDLTAAVPNQPVSATVTAVAAATTAVTFDAATAAQLRTLPGQHAALAETVRMLTVVDPASLRILEGRSAQLQRMFEEEAKAMSAKTEKDLIHANDNLQIYYQFFARLLNGTWMACQSIASGMVGNAETYKSDYVGQGLDQIGQRIPGIGLATGFLSGAIKLWNDRDKKLAVQRMSMLFVDPDVNAAFKALNQLARDATLKQSKSICSMPAPQTLLSKIKEGAKDFGAYILASDANTPLRRKAEEDCKLLLTAIKDGKLPVHPSQKQMLTVIVGKDINDDSSPAAATTAASPAAPSTAAAAVPLSPTADANVLALLRTLQERDAETKAELQRVQAELRRLKVREFDEEHEVFGANGFDAQKTKSKAIRRGLNTGPATASAAHAAVVDRVQDVETRSDVHTAQLGEQADEIAALKAKLKQLEDQKRK